MTLDFALGMVAGGAITGVTLICTLILAMRAKKKNEKIIAKVLEREFS